MLGMRDNRNFQVEQFTVTLLNAPAAMPQQKLRTAHRRDFFRTQVVMEGD